MTSSTCDSASNKKQQHHLLFLPKEFVDAHHHFLDTGKNEFQAFVGSLLGVDPVVYGPAEYQRDVVDVLEEAAGVRTFAGSVHVECMPNDGLSEAVWVANLSSRVQAIVASCDLTQNVEIVRNTLEQFQQQVPQVKGIRWILDYVGPYDNGETATHVGTTRHRQGAVHQDYLRGGGGGGHCVLPEFERGFQLLQQYGYSFDLQCAPEQLPAAALLIAKYPAIPVAINHLGKPRDVALLMMLSDDDDDDVTKSTVVGAIINQQEVDCWRRGMQAMAVLPNTYCKVSMLGYAVPGWFASSDRDGKIGIVKDLVMEMVDLFGPKRCMVALNWWKNAAISDSDGRSEVGPSPVEYLSLLGEWFKDLSDDDQHRLFSGTAREFYRF